MKNFSFRLTLCRQRFSVWLEIRFEEIRGEATAGGVIGFCSISQHANIEVARFGMANYQSGGGGRGRQCSVVCDLHSQR